MSREKVMRNSVKFLIKLFLLIQRWHLQTSPGGVSLFQSTDTCTWWNHLKFWSPRARTACHSRQPIAFTADDTEAQDLAWGPAVSYAPSWNWNGSPTLGSFPFCLHLFGHSVCVWLGATQRDAESIYCTVLKSPFSNPPTKFASSCWDVRGVGQFRPQERHFSSAAVPVFPLLGNHITLGVLNPKQEKTGKHCFQPVVSEALKTN